VADAAWLKRSIVENRPPHKLADMLFPDPAAYRETLGKLQTYTLTHPNTVVVPSACRCSGRRRGGFSFWLPLPDQPWTDTLGKLV